MTTLRAALIQTRTPASQGAALEQIVPLIRQAAEKGAQLIVTPEGSNLLQRDRALMLEAIKPLEQDPFVHGIRKLAKELRVWILIGSALVARGISAAQTSGERFCRFSWCFCLHSLCTAC